MNRGVKYRYDRIYILIYECKKCIILKFTKQRKTNVGGGKITCCCHVELGVESIRVIMKSIRGNYRIGSETEKCGM